MLLSCRKLKLVASIVLFAVFSWSVAFAEPVKVGLITDLTGRASYYGSRTKMGALLAEKELNASGKEFELIIEDSALDPKQGLSAAQKLVMVDKVDALYVDFTVVATAVATFAESSKKLMVYSAAAESLARKHANVFKTYSDYRQGCYALAKLFKERGVSKIGILKAETEYGELCAEGVRRIVPDAPELSYRSGEVVSSQVLAFKGKGVDTIINTSFEGDISNMVSAAQRLSYNVRFGVAEDSFTHTLMKRHGKTLEGSLIFGLQPLPEELRNRVVEFNDGKPVPSYYEGVGLGYVHMFQLYEAISQCRGKGLECEVTAFAGSEPDERIGFVGWQERIAKMRTIVKEHRGGELHELSSYVVGD